MMLQAVPILVAVGFSFAALSVQAAEKAEVCVKYKKDFGWSKGYAVEATIISGFDLNSAVRSVTQFKSLSTYAVVFWDEGQASIFELPPLSMGRAPLFETEVTDQEGRVWKIKSGNTLCY